MTARMEKIDMDRSKLITSCHITIMTDGLVEMRSNCGQTFLWTSGAALP